MTEGLIEETNISDAWVKLLTRLVAKPNKEISPVVLSVTRFEESSHIKEKLNESLYTRKMASVDTVANTIFPSGISALFKDRSELYNEYLNIIPRIRKVDKRNGRGTYFERLIAYEGLAGNKVNQLEMIITSLRPDSKIKRRSKLQISIFDPRVDHTNGPYQSFPCLQHITFYKTKQGGLVLNSFYAIQYLYERAYGNWMGLINLGRFVAREAGLEFERFNCFIGVELLDELSMEEAKQLLKSMKE